MAGRPPGGESHERRPGGRSREEASLVEEKYGGRDEGQSREEDEGGI